MKTKKTYNEYTKLRLDEVSGVDRPAQPGALTSIFKREGPVGKRLRLLSDEDGHTHLIDDREAGGTTSYEHATDAEMGHSHPWVANDDGTITIGMSDGHKHNVIMKRAGGVTDSVPETQKEGPTMATKKEDPTGGEQVVKQADHDKVVADLALAKSFGTMNDAQKAYASELPEGDERNGFISKSEGERQSIVEKSTAVDPVAYTCIDGTEIKKSAGDAMLRLAKQADEATRQLAAEKSARRDDRLEKRASDELANLPGDATHKAALLGAVEAIPDEAVRKGVGELLKAANTAASSGMAELGTSAKTKGAQDAETKLEDMVNKRASDDGTNYNKALVKVLSTSEGKALYAQTR